MRPVPLYNLKQGINRLRVKGGANPSSLYDLVNGWIAVDGSVEQREGTIRAQTLDGTTHGLMADNGVFNVFSIAQESVPAGYVDNILVPPAISIDVLATVFDFNFGTGTSALSTVGGGTGFGWASGTTNGSHPFGTLTSTPNPPTFQGDAVASLSWDSTGTFANELILIIAGTLTQNIFDTLALTVNGALQTFYQGAATFSTSLLAGFSVWTWPLGSNPFTGGITTSVGQIYTLNTTPPDIETIWFAKPFMGFPYVVAEFQNGDVFHYWLQNSGTWAPNTIYDTGTLILPTVPTGLAYLAQRVSQVNPIWQPEVGIALNNIVEPTEYTGYQYKAVAVAGSSPHTGETEPVWPIVAGGILQEFGDFDTSTTDAGTTQGTTASTAQPLSTTITDRYGDSETIASAGQTAGSTLTLPTSASTAVTVWTKGTLYAPGAVAQPSTSQGGFINAIPNGDFEAGNDGNWILTSGVAFNSTNEYQGNECLSFTCTGNTQTATMNTFGLVTPGQSVTATCYFDPHSSGADLSMVIKLRWYDSSDSFLSQVQSPVQENGGYRLTTVTGTAPPGAAHCRVQLAAANGTSHARTGYADLVSWNLETAVPVSNFLFEAIQATAATSGSVEPTWPTVLGNTVVDGGVTWKAIGTSIITWEAIPIMQSGPTEPVWPTAVPIAVHDASTFTDQNGATVDTSISWITSSRQITDPKNPGTVGVALNSSHVFAIDNDIVDFSAAVDPTDWSSPNNAGYLPTGLNNYGDNPAMVLALYRSNLMVFNSGGYQMWQTDPDPANMAILDAQPVGSIYTRAAQSIANDLMILTEVGVRNIATVGATANMQIGSSGQPVDPLILAQLKAALYTPIALYYPGRGQYWLFFGPQAFVFTVNGNGLKTWSRYIFPDTITDWTLNGGILYLRTAGNLVWQLDASTVVDDATTGGQGGTNTPFIGIIQTPYVDAGPMGLDKELIGVDLVGTGALTLQIGWAQNDSTTFNDNAGFNTSLNVTPPFTVAAADTLTGDPMPFPMTAPSFTLILTFAGNQAWQWQASTFYLTDVSGVATG